MCVGSQGVELFALVVAVAVFVHGEVESRRPSQVSEGASDLDRVSWELEELERLITAELAVSEGRLVDVLADVEFLSRSGLGLPLLLLVRVVATVVARLLVLVGLLVVRVSSGHTSDERKRESGVHLICFNY